MKTVGNKIEKFKLIGVKPGELKPDNAFENLDENSFSGKWKIIVYYPKDFTSLCTTEIVTYDKLVNDFADRDAILMTGSTDNEFCKIAWRNAHDDLKKSNHWQFADVARGENSLINQLGYFNEESGCALRVTLIVDPENIIQHVTVNNLNVGRSPEETLRILDALQTGELCACNRSLGGETIN